MTSRVNWRAWHLEDDHAKAALAALLADAAVRYGVTVLAWVLLSNHLHLVLQSPPAELYRRLTGRRMRSRHFRPWPRNHQNSTVIGQFMRFVRRTMSVRRQKELGLTGRFWEAAYDARPIHDDFSLVMRIAYDHRNPVKAGVVHRPEDYEWSSAREWALGEKGLVPVVFRDQLPFDLELEELRQAVLHYQEERRIDDVAEDLALLLRSGAEPQVLRDFLEERGIPVHRGIRAASRSHSAL